MNIYEKNLQSIKEHKLYLYNELVTCDFKKIKTYLKSVSSITSKDNNEVLVLEKSDNLYRLNSSYRPIEEAKRWASQFEFKNVENVIEFFGLGNGINVRVLLEKIGPKDKIVVFEPDALVFHYVLNQYDMTDIFENNQIFITVNNINGEQFKDFLRLSVNYLNVSSQKFVNYPKYEEIYEKEYESFLQKIYDNNYSKVIERNTIKHVGNREAKNGFLNAKYLKDAVNIMDLKNKFGEDTAAILVAAGPSLDKNVMNLKKAKGKGVIFAVDKALKILLQNGIEPDFIVSLDSNKSLNSFTDREDITIPLVCGMESKPELLDRHKGRKFICRASDFYHVLFEKQGSVMMPDYMGSSVATAAFMVTIQLNFKNIILVGQDLAYDGELSHAGGRKQNLGDIHEMMVDGINGTKVKSRYDWYQFLRWFEDVIEKYPERNVVDATEGGAFIKGTKIATLNDAIDNYCITNVDVDDILNVPPSLGYDSTSYIKAFYHDAIGDLERIKNDIVKVNSYLDKLITENSKGFLDDVVINKYMKKIELINKKMVEAPIYDVLDNYISKDSVNKLESLYKLTGNQKLDRENTYKKSKEIYKIFLNVIDDVKSDCVETLQLI